MRPTTDLVRGAIFDALAAQGADLSRVLDLYAGSGALGIEALSRGGGWCDFVERDGANVALIRENLMVTALAERGRVHRLAVERATERLAEPYSLLLADPPYDDDARATLERIAASTLVGPSATLVLEQSHKRGPSQELPPLELTWSRRYGDTLVSIYRR